MDWWIIVGVTIIIVILAICHNALRREGEEVHGSHHLRKKAKPIKDSDVEEFVRWLCPQFIEQRGVLQPQSQGTDSVDGRRSRPTPESSPSQSFISDFSGQATKTQFAVLVLCSEQGLVNVRPHINPRLPCMPDREQHYDNYLIARPHNGQHAEEIILEKFNALWKAYTRKHGAPVSVILYSFLMPCTDCTNNILDKLAGKNATIAYTSKNFEPNEYPNVQVQENNRQTLRDDGFTVSKVRTN